MDLEILKKKISTFRGVDGKVRITEEPSFMEILFAWEQWKGPMNEFYRMLGSSRSGMAAIIGKAKKLRREGHFPSEEFKKVKIADGVIASQLSSLSGCKVIELSWENGRIIRFGQVEQQVDFLKKAA